MIGLTMESQASVMMVIKTLNVPIFDLDNEILLNQIVNSKFFLGVAIKKLQSTT